MSVSSSRGWRLLVFAILILSPIVYADVSCGTLSEANTVYTLTHNLDSSETCFTIAANNVTIDCHGFRIFYGLNWGNGVDNSDGYDMLTVKNCKIYIYSEHGSDGIFQNGDNGTIINNSIIGYHYTDGIFLALSAEFNSIINNTISAGGIYLDSSSNNIISSNRIRTSDLYDRGISLRGDANYNLLINNDIYSSGASSVGIYLDISSYNTLASNSIYSPNIDILLLESNNNTIYNNLLNSSTPVVFEDIPVGYSNYWNATNQTGTRIYSNGNHVGGNYYTNPAGTGFSDTCIDENVDGFCDNAYNVTTNSECIVGLTCGNNTDYLPYSSLGMCELGGNNPPCETVTLEEVVDYVQLWVRDEVTLSDVVRLINAWVNS
jgi:parallel beta-helix repeat protein